MVEKLGPKGQKNPIIYDSMKMALESNVVLCDLDGDPEPSVALQKGKDMVILLPLYCFLWLCACSLDP